MGEASGRKETRVSSGRAVCSRESGSVGIKGFGLTLASSALRGRVGHEEPHGRERQDLLC